MTTNPTYDIAEKLDASNDGPPNLRDKHRTRAKVVALSLLGAALLALFGAMYARSPANAPSFRTGTSR